MVLHRSQSILNTVYHRVPYWVQYYLQNTPPQSVRLPENIMLKYIYMLMTLYIFQDEVPSSQLETLMILQSCVSEIKSWMAYNKLKFNDNKSEFLVVCAPWSRNEIRVKTSTVGTSLVEATVSARNLGVHIDHTLKMDVHIQKQCQSMMAQLKNVADIRRYLEKQAAEKLIHAFVGSRLDYCNSLLVGIPETSLAKLQRVQNIAARILTGTRKYDHVTPVLYKLSLAACQI